MNCPPILPETTTKSNLNEKINMKIITKLLFILFNQVTDLFWGLKDIQKHSKMHKAAFDRIHLQNMYCTHTE